MDAYEKDFEGWHNYTLNHLQSNRPRTFKQQEIWWCSIGVNIGTEMDGKSPAYTRPVLVIRKFNKSLFFGVPLSSIEKVGAHYHMFMFKNKSQRALLSQARSFDASRLTHLMGKLNTESFEEIKQALQSSLKLQ